MNIADYISLKFRNCILEYDKQQYEDFFSKIMRARNSNFQQVKPWGNIGDEKNDGFDPKTGTFYQVFAPEDSTKDATIYEACRKLEKDFISLYESWHEFYKIKVFNFVINEKGKGIPSPIIKRMRELGQDERFLHIEMAIFDTEALKNEFDQLSQKQQCEILGILNDYTNEKVVTTVIEEEIKESIPEVKPFIGDGEYVFINYSHKDKSKVLPIIASLQEYGIRCWYDAHIEMGVRFSDAIQTAIDRSSAFISILSPHTFDSKWCPDEIHYALDKKEKSCIIPLYLGETELLAGLGVRFSQIQGIKLNEYKNQTRAIERIIVRLLQVAPGVFVPQEELFEKPSAVVDAVYEQTVIDESNVREIQLMPTGRKKEQETIKTEVDEYMRWYKEIFDSEDELQKVWKTEKISNNQEEALLSTKEIKKVKGKMPVKICFPGVGEKRYTKKDITLYEKLRMLIFGLASLSMLLWGFTIFNNEGQYKTFFIAKFYKNIFSVLVGIVLMLIISKININFLKKPKMIIVIEVLCWILILGSLILPDYNKGFLEIGIIRFYTVYLLPVILMLRAANLSERANKGAFTFLKYIIIAWGIASVYAAFAFVSKGVYYGLLIIGTMYGITFFTTKKKGFHVLAFACVIVVGIIITKFASSGDYYRYRIDIWLNPENYANSFGYEYLQMKLAIQHAGLFGCRCHDYDFLLQSTDYTSPLVPLIHNCGYLGGISLMLLFCLLIVYLFKIYKQESEVFNSIIVLSLITEMFWMGIMLIGTTFNTLPHMSAYYPLISYGGIFPTLMYFVQLGLVYGIAKPRRGKRKKILR